MKLIGLIIFTLLSVQSGTALSKEQSSVSQCQNIVNKINYYTDQRRAGGSSSHMNRLKKQRDKYEDQYSDYNCKKLRKQLKR